MTFRADEAARRGFEEEANYLIGPSIKDANDRYQSKAMLEDIVDELGPVVKSFPSWHPLVCNHPEHRHPITSPCRENGYLGLDHTVFFVNGFITCPYNDGQKVIESVKNLPPHPVASISAERLNVKFYNEECTPILVKCKWDRPLETGQMIPLSLAIPLILEQEVPCWRWSSVAETWETMRPYLLGSPRGSRSSLFVSQETGQGIKKLWETLIYTGIFGPIKV